jgi:phosphoglycolate phosphatase-like HAD superfamily hydrolase
MALAGLSRARVDADLTSLWGRYIDHLDEELRHSVVRAFPGVSGCLARVEARSTDAIMGLLTGNIEAGARRKLDASGIGFDRFRVGVFGSDSEHRERLPAIAARRAEALVGVNYTGTDVVIVGDTPADIACGEAFGARTVAVATGVYSRQELHACAPDFLFDSLENSAAVWDAIAG